MRLYLFFILILFLFSSSTSIHYLSTNHNNSLRNIASNTKFTKIDREEFLSETTDEILKMLEEKHGLIIKTNDHGFKKIKRQAITKAANYSEIIKLLSVNNYDVILVQQGYRVFKWLVIAPIITTTLLENNLTYLLPIIWNTILSSRTIAIFYWKLKKKILSKLGKFKYGATLKELDLELIKVFDPSDTKKTLILEAEILNQNRALKIHTNLLELFKAKMHGNELLTFKTLENIINDDEFILLAKKFKVYKPLYGKILIEYILKNPNKTKELYLLSVPKEKFIATNLQIYLLNARDTFIEMEEFFLHQRSNFKNLAKKQFEITIKKNLLSFYDPTQMAYKECRKVEKLISNQVFIIQKKIVHTRYKLAVKLLKEEMINIKPLQKDLDNKIKQLRAIKNYHMAFTELVMEMNPQNYNEKINRFIKEYQLESLFISKKSNNSCTGMLHSLFGIN